MQRVSLNYKEGIKKSLRERGYMMLSFGLINQEAQTNATIGAGNFAYYSNNTTLFEQHTDDLVYATLEEDFTRVDGSMLFLPREGEGSYYDTGLIGADLVSDGQYELTIELNTDPIDFKGITINFGENYPVNFDIVGNGQTIEVRGNTDSEYRTETVIENTDSVTLVIYTMLNPASRLRIYSIIFGYGLVYYNKSIINSTFNSYISPIGAEVPQMDFSVTLDNHNQYFNPDNPDSAINFFETGQEMYVYYGLYIPETDKIEWVPGTKLLCSDWDSDDYTATIRCQDVFRNLTGEYYKGLYRSAGISYYNLAELILTEAGVEDYYLDSYLKLLYTKNPMPRVGYKEALQIIANACRCTLLQDRDGKIVIKSNFIPDKTITSNGETTYSDVTKTLEITDKQEYATLSADYATVDGSMYFLSRDLTRGIYTGFISDAISDENGEFTNNPVLTVTQEAVCMFYGVSLIFGNTLPSGIIFRTYNDGTLVEEYTATENIEKNYVLSHDFYDFDVMEIEFTGTANPYNRIVVDYFTFGELTNFAMEKSDMTSSPKAVKQELVKEVIVPCYLYKAGTQLESLVSESGSYDTGETRTYFMDSPSYNYQVTVDGVSTGITVVASGDYYITITFTQDLEGNLDISGYKYIITERYVINTLNTKGKTIKWSNPLISDMTMAQDLAEWLGDYYEEGVEYEYDTRGYPELDANDVIYQENAFIENMTVDICQLGLTFNGAFKGNVTTRKVGA